MASTFPWFLAALPFALPAAARDVLKGRVQAVGVVADVTLVTQQEASGVARLATSLTHRTLQTPPAFTQHHFSDLQHTHTGARKLIKSMNSL